MFAESLQNTFAQKKWCNAAVEKREICEVIIMLIFNACDMCRRFALILGVSYAVSTQILAVLGAFLVLIFPRKK